MAFWVEHLEGKNLGKTFRISATSGGDVRTLDPVRIGDSASYDVAAQIYDGLVQLDAETLKPLPSLANRWEVSQDGLTYTFHLRKNVRFQDDPCFPGGAGREMTAEDFRYSLTRVCNPKTLSTGWWLFDGRVRGANAYRQGKSKNVSGFEVPGRYTFRIHLTRPFAPFLGILAMPYCYGVPREAIQLYGQDFFRHPVGTGAFTLKKWEPDTEILLAKNPTYWEKDSRGNPLPTLDHVQMIYRRDNHTAFLEFENGNTDAAGIPPEDWDRVMTPQKTLRESFQKFHLTHGPNMNVEYYGFNMTKPPLGTNKLLRQALNYAIDRQTIIDKIMNGRGLPAKGPLPPSVPGYNPKLRGYSYNPKKARELMALAGFPDGKGLPEITLHLNQGGGTGENIAEAIQDMLKGIGVRVKILVLPWPQYLDLLEKGEVQFFRLGWNADYPDPENFLALFDGRKQAPAGPNHTFYKNPAFDTLYDAAVSSVDEEERFRLYREAEKIVVEEAPWLYLFYGYGYGLQQPALRGLPRSPMGLAYYKYIDIGSRTLQGAHE